MKLVEGGCYYNLLNKKYFKNSVYIKKFEEVFDVKIKDCPLQYELVFETLNTIIKGNNILYSKNYIPKEEKVDKLLNLFNGYLTKYKNKIEKCYDSASVGIYYHIEIIAGELEEMRKEKLTRAIKYNLKPIENTMSEYIALFLYLKIDAIRDNRGMYYQKQANDKLPKKVICKLKNDTNSFSNDMWYSVKNQQQVNDLFMAEYLRRTGIDLKNNDMLRETIFDIHTFVQDTNNYIQELMINYDELKLKLFKDLGAFYFASTNFKRIEDIYYHNLLNKLKNIYDRLGADDLNELYRQIQEIINSVENKQWYERID